MVFQRFIFIFWGVICFQNVGSANAQIRLKELTEDNVTRFIQDVSALASGQESRMDQASIVPYLDKHIDDDARFKTSITYNIPGYPAQTKDILLDKNGYIENIKAGATSVKHYYADVSVDTIRISNDGKRATVDTTSLESGIMEVPSENGESEEVPIEGVSKCFQILNLSKKGVLQMYSASCKTDVTFQK